MMELNTFAVAVYSENGVADACLTLQDDYQIDVPLLLFCAWYGTYYGRLPAALLAQASEISRQLGAHLIKPLRQTRRWMKTHSVDVDTEQRWHHLREEIKRAELEAEMLMLDTLALIVDRATETVCADTAGSDVFKGDVVKGDSAQQRASIIHNMLMLFDADAVISDEPLLTLISAASQNTAHSR